MDCARYGKNYNSFIILHQAQCETAVCERGSGCAEVTAYLTACQNRGLHLSLPTLRSSLCGWEAKMGTGKYHQQGALQVTHQISAPEGLLQGGWKALTYPTLTIHFYHIFLIERRNVSILLENY